MQYISTREPTRHVGAAQAIVAGLSGEGGLYVPEAFPQISLGQIKQMVGQGYAQRAQAVLETFLTDYSQQEVAQCVQAAYAPARFGAHPAPLKKVGDNYVLELWHGPTHAFKDMALQILPHLMTRAMRKVGMKERVFVLVATSGDTGKAALEGFCNVPDTAVGVFFPVEGVSPAQRMQMVTQQGDNVHVCAVNGNFDDAQAGVKRIFGDTAFAGEMGAAGWALSSANSINWGRLVPQVAYYFSAYADLVAAGGVTLGQPVNFCVPTGNFGNILAAYYAKRMGLPVGRLLCASNRNNVLFDFMQDGGYDKNRPFHRTTSPSMDILISSNLERLLFELCGRDEEQVRAWMGALAQAGRYQVGKPALERLQESFSAGWADDGQALGAIGTVYAQHGYTMDPHTAVAWSVAQAYKEGSGDRTPTLVVSTASPFKFSRDVLRALKGEAFAAPLDEFQCADALEQACGLMMPMALRSLRNKPARHTQTAEPDQMLEVVRGWAKG